MSSAKAVEIGPNVKIPTRRDKRLCFSCLCKCLPLFIDSIISYRPGIKTEKILEKEESEKRKKKKNNFAVKAFTFP